MADEESKPAEKKLTGKEQRFIDEYCVDCNGTKAAIRVGYSVRSACEIAYEILRKPHIKNAIDAKLKEMSLSANATTKLIVDIAKASINPYLKIVTRERTPQIRVPLQTIIDSLIEEIAFEDEFALIAGFDDKEKEQHHYFQEGRKRRLLRMQLVLRKNPDATDMIAGSPQMEEYAELDLVALAKDKEAGRIKSIKHTENGLQVEMYAADAALTNLARMHGLFEKDNAQSKSIIPGLLQIEVVPPKDEE